MKNIEKYPYTKDALEAYNQTKLTRVPFTVWLKCGFEEPHEPTLLEAAEAVIDEWYYTQQNVTLNDLGEKMVELKKTIEREKRMMHAQDSSSSVENTHAENAALSIKKNQSDVRLSGSTPRLRRALIDQQERVREAEAKFADNIRRGALRPSINLCI